MSYIDSVIENFRAFIEQFKKHYHENESNNRKNQESYEEIMKSKTVSRETKLIYTVIRENEYGRSADLASKISLLYSCSIMATTIKILENSLNVIENQFSILETKIADSKIFEKNKDIEDIKKLKATLKTQKEEREKALKEALRILEESRKKDLSYIDWKL